LKFVLTTFLSLILALTGPKTGDLMDRRFVYTLKDGGYSKAVTLAKVRTMAALRVIPAAGPFTLTVDGENVRYGVTRVKVLKAFKHGLQVGKVGPVYRIRDTKDVVFGAREVVPAIKQLDTNGNDKADAYWSAVKAEFPNITFLGSYVCKYIAGSTNMSQHSYGNAVDLNGGSMAFLEQIANWDVAHADELHLEHVIVNRRIWTRGWGWASYGGETHFHVHVDFLPSYSGSCGVRG